MTFIGCDLWSQQMGESLLLFSLSQHKNMLCPLQAYEGALQHRGDYSQLSEEAVKESSLSAHVTTNEQLHATEFDDTLSGTTAISVLLKVSFLAHGPPSSGRRDTPALYLRL